MPPKPIESPDFILHRDAQQLLHDWRGFLQPMTAHADADGWRCVITFEPAPASLPVVKLVDPLATKLATVNQCARDVFGVLPPWPERISKSALVARLDAAKKYHSDRSISRAAQQLHRLGLIVIPARGSNEGYGLAA